MLLVCTPVLASNVTFNGLAGGISGPTVKASGATVAPGARRLARTVMGVSSKPATARVCKRFCNFMLTMSPFICTRKASLLGCQEEVKPYSIGLVLALRAVVGHSDEV